MMLAEFSVFLALIAAQIADIATTKRGLERGFIEANPVIAFFMSRLGRRWTFAKAALGLIPSVYSLDQGSIWLPLGVAVATALVAYRNHRIVT